MAEKQRKKKGLRQPMDGVVCACQRTMEKGMALGSRDGRWTSNDTANASGVGRRVVNWTRDTGGLRKYVGEGVP